MSVAFSDKNEIRILRNISYIIFESEFSRVGRESRDTISGLYSLLFSFRRSKRCFNPQCFARVFDFK